MKLKKWHKSLLGFFSTFLIGIGIIFLIGALVIKSWMLFFDGIILIVNWSLVVIFLTSEEKD